MMFKEFAQYVAKNISSYLPGDCAGAEICIQDIQKPGKMMTALSIRKADSNIAPAIYLERFYKDFCDGETSIYDVMSEIARCYEANSVAKAFPVDRVINWDQAKKYLVARLVNISNGVNNEYLSICPIDKLTADIGVLYEIFIQELSGNDGTAAVKVSYDLMKKWGIHQYNLSDAARKNLPVLRPVEITTMEEQMASRGLPTIPMKTPILIVSNKRYSNGAIAVLYDGIEEEIRKRLGDFILLPSSIHEMLAIPMSGADPIALAEMINEVNQTAVRPEEQLSSVPYVLENGKLRAIK